MNVALALNPAGFALCSSPSQGKINAQAALGGGSDFSRDTVAKRSQRRRASTMLGARVTSNRLVLAEAKVGSVRRG